MNNNKRHSWEEYFLDITSLVGTRATCIRRKIGAIIVKDKRILTTGYNGSSSTLQDCVEIGHCMREELGIPSGEQQQICRAIHAEENCIIQSALYGVSIKNSVLYCTNQPCVMCMRKIINCKFKRLVYLGAYPDKYAMSLLKECPMTMNTVDIGKYTNVTNVNFDWK